MTGWPSEHSNAEQIRKVIRQLHLAIAECYKALAELEEPASQILADVRDSSIRH